MKEIDYDRLKQELYGRVEFCLNAITKGDRDEAKTGFTCSMMTEEEFDGFWPKDQEITLNEHGRFQYKGFWFELRSVYSQDTSYYDNLAFEGFILFAKYRLYGNYELCSGLIEPYQGLEHLSPVNHWDGYVVPEVVLKIADEYITKKREEED